MPYTELITECISETLPTGYSMEIRARDGLSVSPTRRRAASTKPRSIPTQTAANGASSEEVKQWLVDNGQRKDKRGTISEAQMQLHNEAHPA